MYLTDYIIIITQNKMVVTKIRGGLHMLKKILSFLLLSCMLLSTVSFCGDDDLPIPIFNVSEYGIAASDTNNSESQCFNITNYEK